MQNTFHFLKWSGKKAIVALVLTIVILVTAVNVTIAYLVTRTRSLPNTFAPAEIEISSWSFQDVINAGDTKVYVRASIVPSWVSNDDKKTVWSVAPKENVDYTLTVSENWFLGSDGFYYRKEMLNAAQSVNFLNATTLTEKEGYTLRILVLYSAIQVEPADAVNQSWSAVEVDGDGKLQPKQK